MKKIRFLLLVSIILLLTAITVFASGSVYELDGKKTAFLSNSETVSYNGAEYNAYASVNDALSALSAAEGDAQAIVVGDFHMSDNTTDSTFKMPIKSLVIKGADSNAIFNQYTWLEFYTGPVTIDNIKWHGKVGNKGICAQDLTITESVTTTGNRQYLFGYDTTSPVQYVKTTVKGSKYLVISAFYSSTTVGSASNPGYVYMQLDGGDCQYYVYAGGNGGSSTVYGNVFLVMNGGTYSNGLNGNVSFNRLGTVTGKKIAILSNDMGEQIAPVGYDILVKAQSGGNVTVEESTLSSSAPVLVLTPYDEALAPYVNNSALEKTDGKYTVALSANGEYNVTWGEPANEDEDEEELKRIDVIDGKQTVFLSNAETVTYNGNSYIPYNSLSEALTVLSETEEDAQAIVVGDFHMVDNALDSTFKMPIKSLVIKGADSNAIFNQYTWLEFYTGPVTIDNIKWHGKVGNKGICAQDLTITERVTTTGNRQYLFGYDTTSPVQYVKTIVKGSKYLVISAFYNSTTVGSENNPGYAYIQLDGGDCQYYVYAGGNSGSSTVYGNVFLVINGGTYSNGLGGNVSFNRLGTVTGKKIAILGNDMGEQIAPVGYDILVKAQSGGSVTVEESTLSSSNPVLVLTPDEGSGKVPFVNGKSVNEENGKYTYTLTNDGVYEIGWAEIPDGFYFVNGLPTIFLSNSDTATYDGSEYQAFSSLVEAMEVISATNAETQAIVCGDFHPDERTDVSFNGERGHLILTGLDSTSKFNQYTWLYFLDGPLTIKNLIWNNVQTKAIVCPDLVIEESVTMTGNSLYLFTNYSGNVADSLEMTVNSGKYIVTGAFYQSTTVGTPEKNSSVYMELNGGLYEYFVYAGGNGGSSTVYGNMFLVINGGTYKKGLENGVKFINLASVTGKKVAIVNNNMSRSVVPADYDILVNSGNGGLVSVDESTRASANPVLILTPQEGTTNVPFINGKVADIKDGEYRYTLEENGQYNVEWKDLTPQSYVINGVKTVFMSDLNVVSVNGEFYVPFASLQEAFEELGTEGGHAVVCDDFTPDAAFTDVEGRGKIFMYGHDRFAVFHQYHNFTFSGGPIEISDLTLHVSEVYTYLGGKDITIGDGVSVSSEGAGQIYVVGGCKAANVDKVRVTVNSGTLAQVGAGGLHAGFVIGSPEKRGSSVVTLNGGDMSNSYFMSGGAYRNTTIYGNVYIIANGGNFGSERTLLDTQLTKGDENSRIIVLFNGTGAVMSTDVADVVIHSEKGGNVALDESTAESVAPVFVLTPDENMIPFVDGEMLEMTNGRYEITIDESVSEVHIKWSKNINLSFDLNGGEGNVPEDISVIIGQTVSLPSGDGITKADNVFVGWNTDKNAKEAITTITDANKSVLYAVWKSTVPRITDRPNLEANGVSEVNVTIETMTAEESDNAKYIAESNPALLANGKARYAFKITAYDENKNVVDFENGINFVIPSEIFKYDTEEFEFIRLYNVFDNEAKVIDEVSFEDDGIYFTCYNSGIIVLATNTPVTSKYIYDTYESDGKVYVDIYYNGVAAQSGFFGVKYSNDALESATFTYADGLSSAGSDFGVYTNEGGIFFDAFELKTEDGAELFIGTQDKYVPIGTLELTKTAEEYEIKPINDPEEVIDGYTYGAGLLFIPYCDSTFTYFQPVVAVTESVEAVIGNKMYSTLESAVEASTEGDTIVVMKDAHLESAVTLKENTTLVLNKSVTGEKIKLVDSAKVISNQSILSALCADTLIGYNFENGNYTYIASPYSDDYLVFDGAQIRLVGTQALRFVATVNDALENCNLTDYGFIIIPENISDLENTDHTTEKIGEVSLKTRGDAFRYYEQTEDSFTFTIALTNISVAQYERKYVARPFVRYESDGIEYTVYADYQSKYNLSVYQVASGLLNYTPEGAVADALRAIIKEYDDYIASK